MARLQGWAALAAVVPATIAFTLGSPAVALERVPEEGTVVATNAHEGRLVVEDRGDLRHLVVDFAAPISDDRGSRLDLRDVRPGDCVHYDFEILEGAWTAVEIRVTAGCGVVPAPSEP